MRIFKFVFQTIMFLAVWLGGTYGIIKIVQLPNTSVISFIWGAACGGSWSFFSLCRFIGLR